MKSLPRNRPLEILLLLASTTAALQTSFLGPNPCCEALYMSPHIPSLHLHYPGEISHKELQRAPRHLNNHHFTPPCFYTPNATDEVAQAIKILLATNKTISRGCKFSMRNGGDGDPGLSSHQSNIDIMMDLRKLNSITYHSSNATLSVGPGTTWREVYTYLSELPRSISQPRNDIEEHNQTQIALQTPKLIPAPPSLLLSSPSNTFDSSLSDFFQACAPAISSPQRSLSCDAVANFEVVLGDGGWLVNANAKEHSDLFKALQSRAGVGAANFGVVTRFDLQVAKIAEGSFWGGVVKYPESTAEDQFKALSDFAENVGKPEGRESAGESANVVVMEKYSSLNGRGKLEFWNAYTNVAALTREGEGERGGEDMPHTTPAHHPPATLQPFLSIPFNTSSTTKHHLNPTSLFLSSSSSSSQQQQPKTHYLQSFSLIIPASSSLLLHKTHLALLTAITTLEESALGSWTVSATYQPFFSPTTTTTTTTSSTSTSESSSKKQAATAAAATGKTLLLYEAFFEYQNLKGKPVQDGLFQKHARDLRRVIEGEVEKLSGGGGGAGKGLEVVDTTSSPSSSSSAANNHLETETLREIAARYDPEGVFTYMVPPPPRGPRLRLRLGFPRRGTEGSAHGEL